MYGCLLSRILLTCGSEAGEWAGGKYRCTVGGNVAGVCKGLVLTCGCSSYYYASLGVCFIYFYTYKICKMEKSYKY